MRKTGNFEDVVYLEDDTEIAVNVQWEGENDRGDRWTPPNVEMNLTVEPFAEWPEGLSEKEFKAAIQSADYRLTDRAWQEFRDAE